MLGGPRWCVKSAEEEGMGFQQQFGPLLNAIADDAKTIAMRFFREDSLRIDRKLDGTIVTQADRSIEEMARAKVVASGLALDVLGEEMGGDGAKLPNLSDRPRL